MTTPTDAESMDVPMDVATLVDSLLAPGGIRAVFQPVVRVADGAVIGYEALSRSTAMPMMSPAAWLEAAEGFGRRADVELACLAAVAAAGEPPGRGLIFLNTSPDVAADPRFGALCARLPRHVVEVTEHMAVEDYEPLLEALGALRSNGALIAVDDVGAGYASMAHVLQLSPSFIKIDRFLVSGLHLDPRRRALVEALQAFASATGALTVAEGVETPEELRALKEIGVDLAQGFLLARPADPWAALSVQAAGVLIPRQRTAEPQDPGLEEGLARSATPAEACEAVSRHLARQGGLLPSVYLERGGVLRCLSRRGQWLVMDGLQPGAGIAGTAYSDGVEIHCPDVTADARYRLAVPGVCAEIAVPLRAHGAVVGVLNVDALAPLLPEHQDLVRRCAQLLGARLEELHAEGAGRSVLHELGRLAPALAVAASPEDLCRAALGAVLDLTGFDSGALWTFDAGPGPHGAAGVTVAARRGPVADVLVGLPDGQVHQLRELVTDLTSCYSGGTDLSLAVPPMHTLRETGIRGALVVPLRDGWNLTGVLVVVSTSSSYVAPDAVDAIEALVLQAGSRLAALRRVAELSGVAAHVHQLLAPRAAGAPWGSGGRRVQGNRDVAPARITPA